MIELLSFVCYGLAVVCLVFSIAYYLVGVRKKRNASGREEQKPANPDLTWYLEKILEQLQQLPDCIYRIEDRLSRLFIFGTGIVISLQLFTLGILFSILATLIRLF